MASAFDHKEFLSLVSVAPGVYRMLDANGQILYVGKAKNLRNRLTSYFVKDHANRRIKSMVSQIASIEVAITHTEAEALLLESNLIKEHRPRYNIVLRDDKSYPQIYLSTNNDYPGLYFHRGARKKKGRYFGPYPSSGAVRMTLTQLQKVFRVRQCDESYFRNRSRPCLQYQIERCTGPCVGKIGHEEYAEDVADTIKFLAGKSEALIGAKIKQMEDASALLEFELAGKYRDQIEMLRKITEQQYISGAKGNVDIVVAEVDQGVACVQLFMIRQGNSLGNRSFFPKLPDPDASPSQVVEAFLGQYYSGHEIPSEILLLEDIEHRRSMIEMLTQRKENRVKIGVNVRGERARWVAMAKANAVTALAAKLSSKATSQQRYEALQKVLNLDFLPTRLECFDISHTQGEATVASCVVFNLEGPLSSDYRKFNIKGITPGDDYAAMSQALTRRYRRLKEGEAAMPDILFIDGGRGQLTQAINVLRELQIQGVLLVGVAKGEGRKPGLETLFIGEHAHPVTLDSHSSALHLVQHIRDEAHRFAITGHRQRRAKARVTSTLEDIPGLGPKRRQSLLKQHGGMRGVSRAGVEELAKTPGISKNLAEQIYAMFHSDG